MKSQKSSGRPKKPSLFIVRRVSGDSMLPTLRPGQIILGMRPRDVLPGDVVIIRHGGLEKVKRVLYIGEGGDRIFVIGDNQAGSTDSRKFGWLSVRQVIARVVWPRKVYDYNMPKEPLND